MSPEIIQVRWNSENDISDIQLYYRYGRNLISQKLHLPEFLFVQIVI